MRAGGDGMNNWVWSDCAVLVGVGVVGRCKWDLTNVITSTNSHSIVKILHLDFFILMSGDLLLHLLMVSSIMSFLLYIVVEIFAFRFLRKKYDVACLFLKFRKQVDSSINMKILNFESDCGAEYQKHNSIFKVVCVPLSSILSSLTSIKGAASIIECPFLTYALIKGASQY